MTIETLYAHNEEMNKETVIKVVDCDLHVRYYGKFKNIPDDLLYKLINGFQNELGVKQSMYIIWLSE